nr:MAG TPA: hypothetical protein [Caudoviricetes sp.]
MGFHLVRRLCVTFCRRRQNVTHNLLTRWNPIRL